jgi:FkbM family methyltransferase
MKPKFLRQVLRSVAEATLRNTPLRFWPVRVRRGVAAGARWTLYPWTSYWRGTHEPEVQAALCQLGNGRIEGWNCWDLGAHFGLYSVGLARRVGSGGQVAAFEPNPLSFQRLERHRKMNHLPWLKTFPFAVSDESGEAELFTYGDLGSTTTHLPHRGEARTSDIAPVAVRKIRVDDLVGDGVLRLPQFVKIDVEGHGHHSVAGMRKSIAASHPILLAAVHSEDEIRGMRAELDPLGYCWKHLDGTAADAIHSNRDYLVTPE